MTEGERMQRGEARMSTGERGGELGDFSQVTDSDTGRVGVEVTISRRIFMVERERGFALFLLSFLPNFFLKENTVFLLCLAFGITFFGGEGLDERMHVWNW